MRSVYELWAHSSLLSYFHFFSDPSISGAGRNEWLEDEMCKDIKEHVVITWRLLWGSHNIEKLWEKWRKKGEINHHFWKKKIFFWKIRFFDFEMMFCAMNQWSSDSEFKKYVACTLTFDMRAHWETEVAWLELKYKSTRIDELLKTALIEVNPRSLRH